ncbi:MAG: serine/threonine-protein kinase [Acidobacteriota bacterium]
MDEDDIETTASPPPGRGTSASSDAVGAVDMPAEVGPYRLAEQIGAGGMGEVFLAVDGRTDRRVAIKRIRPERALTPAMRERLFREARYAASLDHPSVVRVEDVLELDDTLYLVMEWVPGEDLRRRLQHGGPMAPSKVIAIGRRLAQGLAAAHDQGIVHRDFKSENVLIDGDGLPKITDFGIAKRIDGGVDADENADDGSASDAEGGTEKDESLTDSGTVLGTYRILSPEQVLGDDVDTRSDLFSFGVMLFEALSGRSPFGESNTLETLHRIVEAEPATLICPDPEPVPPALPLLIADLLAKDPADRPATARDVERRLAALVPGAAGATTAPGSDDPLFASGMSNRSAAAFIALVTLGAVAAVALLFFYFS